MATGHTATLVFCFIDVQPHCFVLCYSSVAVKVGFSSGILIMSNSISKHCTNSNIFFTAMHHIMLHLWLNLVFLTPFETDITRTKIYLCFCLFIISIQPLLEDAGSACFLAWLR